MLAPLWYLSTTQQRTIDDLNLRIQVQETLQPLMSGLAARHTETQALLGEHTQLPTPETLPQITSTLQHLAQLAGMENARFVPAAETVVERNSIRLDGTLMGTPDSFRRLILLLSEQPWLSGMDFLNVTPTVEKPSYSMGIWASFRQKGASPTQAQTDKP